MLFAVAGNTDKLSVERRYKREIFTLGITDDNIVRGSQKAVKYLTFYAETLACARCAEDKSVGIFEP